jgi:hypothetical protein
MSSILRLIVVRTSFRSVQDVARCVIVIVTRFISYVSGFLLAEVECHLWMFDVSLFTRVIKNQDEK